MTQGVKRTSLYRTIWIAAFSFIILTILTLSRHIAMFQTVGFFLFLAIGAVLPVEELLVMLAVLEPQSTLFRFRGSFTVMPFLFILLFLKLFFKNPEISVKKLVVIVSLFAISILNYVFRGYSLISCVSFFIMLMCVVWISDSRSIDVKQIFDRIVWMYTLSVLIECVFSIMMPSAVEMVTTVSEYGYRDIGFSSAWNYGRHIVVAIGFLIYWILEKRKNYYIAVPAIVYLLYCLIRTGLFSGLLALAILMVLIPFTFDGTLQRRIAYMMITLVVVAIMAVALYYWVYLPMLEMRGELSDNGRFDIWQLYLNDFAESTSIRYFGIGAGAITAYAARLQRLTAHNILLEKLFEFGIVGFILLIYLLRCCYSGGRLRLRKNRKLLPLIAFLGTCLTQGMTGNELIFILMILSL